MLPHFSPFSLPQVKPEKFTPKKSKRKEEVGHIEPRPVKQKISLVCQTRRVPCANLFFCIFKKSICKNVYNIMYIYIYMCTNLTTFSQCEPGKYKLDTYNTYTHTHTHTYTQIQITKRNRYLQAWPHLIGSCKKRNYLKAKNNQKKSCLPQIPPHSSICSLILICRR